MVPLVDFQKVKLKNYFNLQMVVLRWLGISFEPAENFWDKLRPFFVSTVGYSYCIIEFLEIVTNVYDIEILSTTVSMLFCRSLGKYSTVCTIKFANLGYLKVLVLIYHKKALVELLRNLEEGLFLPKRKRGGKIEKVLLKKCILYTNRQSLIYWALALSGLAVGMIRGVYEQVTKENSRGQLYPFTPFTLVELPTNFARALIFSYQWLATGYAGFSFTSADLIFAGVLAHLTAHCRILKNAIFMMTRRNDLNWKNLQKTVKEIVMYHQAIIRIAHRFEDIFSLLMLAQFLAAILTLCFLMYNLTQEIPPHLVIFELLFVAGVGIQILIYCYWGNELSLASEEIVQACYEANFVGVDLRFQKSLLIIMERSKEPMVLTAGKFVNLSLETFVSIMKTSYSSAMFLCNIKP